MEPQPAKFFTEKFDGVRLGRHPKMKSSKKVKLSSEAIVAARRSRWKAKKAQFHRKHTRRKTKSHVQK